MLAEILKYAQWLWEAVLLPYVITSLSSLASDGWEAITHLRESVVVLLYFLCGGSHRTFPLSRSAMAAQRSAAATTAKSPPVSAHVTRRSYGCSSEVEENDADSETDVKRVLQVSPAVGDAADPSVAATSGRRAGDDEGTCGGASDAPPLIQRRLLLGKRGEVEEWMPAVRSHPLVPLHHPLCISRSLHQLVSIVVGPIQQPTVSTMPTRHPEPQWPPHFLRTNNSGGGGIIGSNSLADPSTDDNSSSTSSTAPHMLRHRTNTFAAAARYRQASSVVYKRVSSRNLDLSSLHVSPHLIASITAHHVLSYPATRQKVLVMDLDETLCHVSTTTANMAGPPTFSEVIPTASGAELLHVWERPYARLFLYTAAKLFNLVLFTSASKPYADTILQRIDPDHLLKYRYYRQDCRLVPRGLLRKMCAAASMRGLSLAPGGGGGSSSVARGASDLDRGGNTGSGSTTTVPSSSPSLAPDVGDRSSGSTTNSDNDSRGKRGGDWETERSWDSTFSTEARRSLRRGGGTITNDNPLSDPPSVGAAAERGGVDMCFPTVEKTSMNEHAKVLVKDLRLLKVPPELLVMIDNSEECTLVNPENALVVPPYIPALSKTTHPPRETLHRRGSDERGGSGGAAVPQGRNSLRTGNSDVTNTSQRHTTAQVAGGAPDDIILNEDSTANDGPEDCEDEVLLALLPLLECLLVVPDVRSILRHGKLY
ncbi:hypothetical protein JKF63_07776 [Porcisia hertigi]|uniref:FCP1 homology domain-containing protein n=1 Tax=Porcisia hertigi TaxID=2761500 RepID=A0A836YJ17_9TRYP|nr:hypothetical protein JKF63_07776 [Porcisia hertigi]